MKGEYESWNEVRDFSLRVLNTKAVTSSEYVDYGVNLMKFRLRNMVVFYRSWFLMNTSQLHSTRIIIRTSSSAQGWIGCRVQWDRSRPVWFWSSVSSRFHRETENLKNDFSKVCAAVGCPTYRNCPPGQSESMLVSHRFKFIFSKTVKRPGLLLKVISSVFACPLTSGNLPVGARNTSLNKASKEAHHQRWFGGRRLG